MKSRFSHARAWLSVPRENWPGKLENINMIFPPLLALLELEFFLGTCNKCIYSSIVLRLVQKREEHDEIVSWLSRCIFISSNRDNLESTFLRLVSWKVKACRPRSGSYRFHKPTAPTDRHTLARQLCELIATISGELIDWSKTQRSGEIPGRLLSSFLDWGGYNARCNSRFYSKGRFARPTRLHAHKQVSPFLRLLLSTREKVRFETNSKERKRRVRDLHS